MRPQYKLNHQNYSNSKQTQQFTTPVGILPTVKCKPTPETKSLKELRNFQNLVSLVFSLQPPGCCLFSALWIIKDIAALRLHEQRHHRDTSGADKSWPVAVEENRTLYSIVHKCNRVEKGMLDKNWIWLDFLIVRTTGVLLWSLYEIELWTQLYLRKLSWIGKECVINRTGFLYIFIVMSEPDLTDLQLRSLFEIELCIRLYVRTVE